jgi:ATP-dependent Clp protease ATP-binding subunit ClpX
MRPPEINDQLARTVIGQREVLRYVSVAIFKHLEGEPFGNLIMIGSSGTGKTTVMRAVERFYAGTPELSKYRVVVILNANTFANDEGVIDTSRLFVRLEERARRILGENADPAEIGLYMQHATVCLDEIDKVSSVVGGKPYVTGINIQQALLTLIEGETVDWTLAQTRNGREEKTVVHIDTSKMLFFAGGAFEALYDQVFRRVTSPTSRVKLPTETVIVDDRVHIREYFTLRHHFRQEDLFDYGMQPQFLARFDNSIILEDLSTEMLQEIFMLPGEGLFYASQQFFRRYEIDLRISDNAVRRLATEAALSSRIGARALKGVYAKVIKPFEFDPFTHDEVRRTDDGGYELVIEEELVRKAVRPELTIPA